MDGFTGSFLQLGLSLLFSNLALIEQRITRLDSFYVVNYAVRFSTFFSHMICVLLIELLKLRKHIITDISTKGPKF